MSTEGTLKNFEMLGPEDNSLLATVRHFLVREFTLLFLFRHNISFSVSIFQKGSKDIDDIQEVFPIYYLNDSRKYCI